MAKIDKDKAKSLLSNSDKTRSRRNYNKELSFYSGGSYSIKFPVSQEVTESWKQHTERVERFSYYIIGLTVASVGYTVHLTSSSGYHCELVFVSGSLIFWCLGISAGLQFVLNGTAFIKLNMEQVKIQEDESLEIDEATSLLEGNDNQMREIVKAQAEDYKRVLYFFVSGLSLFIIWRLFEIYLFNPCDC